MLAGAMLQSQPRRLKAAGEQVHLEFNDANSEHLDVTWLPFTGSGSPLSFLAWVRLPSSGAGNRVIQEWGSASGNGTRVTFRIGSGGSNLRIEVGGNAQKTNFTAADGQWHFVGFAYNGNGNMDGFTVFMDGQSENISNSQSLSVDSTFNLDLMNGPAFASFVANAHMPGDMDHVMYFSRELSLSEVQWMQREWLTGREPDLELYLPFTENTGAPVDWSPNTRAVFLNNSPTWKEG